MIKKLLFAILTLIIFISCKSENSKITPIAIKGNLDLSQWDISSDGPIKLNGEWEFYWKQFLTNEDFKNNKISNIKKYFKVPDTWNDYQIDKNKKLPSHGYATFRLNIKNIKHKSRLSFKFLDMGLSYILYANGKKLTSVGNPGRSYKEMIPKYRPHTAELYSKDKNIELILHISNFHHRKGGPWDSILMGTYEDIHNIQNKNIALELFLFGSFIIMAFYHIGLFLLRKKEKSYIYFGIYALLISLFTITTGERFIIHIIPGINWEFLFKLIYLSFYLSIPTFFLFIYSLFPDEISKIILKLSIFIGTIFSLFVLVTPSKIYASSNQIYQLFSLILIVYIIIAVFVAAVRKRVEHMSFFLEYSFFFLL